MVSTRKLQVRASEKGRWPGSSAKLCVLAGLWLMPASGCAAIHTYAACEVTDLGTSIFRSPEALEAQLTPERGDGVRPEPASACQISGFDHVDWRTQAVVAIARDGGSRVEHMSVRGDRLRVRGRRTPQCGGQELLGPLGVLFVIVPAEVQKIEFQTRRTKPCPNRRGPSPP